MKKLMNINLCYVFVVILSCAKLSTSIDTLIVSQSITSNQTLISAKNEFQLGFYSPGNSMKFYVAIWFNILPTRIVWIANRDTPLNDTSGVLKIGNDGNLVLLDKAESILWSTHVQNISSRSTVVQLLDSGNLVLRDTKNEEKILWQSFDYPSHTLIAGMKLGWDLKTGFSRNLTSWRNSDDPSPGEYTFGFALPGLPQIIIWKGSSKVYRSGPWNGVDFGGISFKPVLPFNTEVIIDSKEVYYVHRLNKNSSIMMTPLTPSGTVQIIVRDNLSKDWRVIFVVPQDNCGDYAACGPNAICTISDAQPCACMTAYTPKIQREWDSRVWSSGCVLENPFNCSERGYYKDFIGMKMPDLLQSRVDFNMSVEECEAECSKNCSCTAYANANATGAGHGCLLWFGDLIDVRKLTMWANQTLHVRVRASDVVLESDSKKKNKTIVIVVAIIVSSILLLLAVLFFIWKRKSHKEEKFLSSRENLELPYFDIITIERATENFFDLNKIGEGGFGPVYKGKLLTGQEIAVKRLAENSRQGLIEFKNEVMLIAKLQHRNLVRLLGCCIHGEERMLIYEYMPNGSLDSYVFGANSHLFVWRRRFSIVVGIARGLLYLHRDSRLRIIHRDLKASNVLLDSEMNPKISDFGMARAFGEEQCTDITTRVVGTYGYMSPEYAIDGIYSMKSDVYSFGVLVLEIVSGKRNSQFRHPDHDFNLLGHAWQLWVEGRGSELYDPLMEDSFSLSEVLRCIQVGLLCVQQRPEDRPSMSSVLLMLDSESAMLPQPTRPGYFTERFADKSDSLSGGTYFSNNDITDTLVEGR